MNYRVLLLVYTLCGCLGMQAMPYAYSPRQQQRSTTLLRKGLWLTSGVASVAAGGLLLNLSADANWLSELLQGDAQGRWWGGCVRNFHSAAVWAGFKKKILEKQSTARNFQLALQGLGVLSLGVGAYALYRASRGKIEHNRVGAFDL